MLIHTTQKKRQRKGLPRKGLELLVSTEIRACPVLVPLATSAQEEAQLFRESISVILKGFHQLTQNLLIPSMESFRPSWGYQKMRQIQVELNFLIITIQQQYLNANGEDLYSIPDSHNKSVPEVL